MEAENNNGAVAPQPVAPVAPPVKTMKKSKSKLIMLVLLVLMTLAALGFAGLWFKTRQDDEKNLDVATQQLNNTITSLTSAKAELTATAEKLDKAQMVPALSDFSPQCSTKSNDNNLLVTPVMAKPVDGYQLFLIDCKQDLAKGKSVAKLTGFKVGEDGKYTFAYGASSLEPFCIDKGIFGDVVANKLVTETGLALCKKT